MNWIRTRLSSVFGVDYRSLAVLRVLLGCLLISDLMIRCPDWYVMYSEAGILTTQQSEAFMGKGVWSIYWFFDSPGLTVLCLAITAVVNLCLLIGYRTTVMSVLSWVLLVSLQNRNPLILNGGDTWLRMLLFWGMFLPWGAVWSVDARNAWAGQLNKLGPVATAATACLILQISVVYWFGGLFKMNSLWLGFDPWALLLDSDFRMPVQIGGDALLRALRYPTYIRPLSKLLLSYPEVIRSLAACVPMFEILLGSCIFFPIATSKIRLMTIFAAVAFHLSIEAVLHVGQFSLIACAAWLALLPSEFWNSRFFQRIVKRTHGIQDSAGRFSDDAASIVAESQTWTSAALCMLCLSVVMAWNVASIFRDDVRQHWQGPHRSVAATAMLWQKWNMFSRPTPTQSLFVFVGESTEGSYVNAQTGQSFSAVTIATADCFFANHRWRKLNANLDQKRYAAYRENVASAILREWNRTHSDDEKLAAVSMYRFQFRTDGSREVVQFNRILTVP